MVFKRQTDEITVGKSSAFSDIEKKMMALPSSQRVDKPIDTLADEEKGR